jgi:hypothetical protein
MPNRIFVIAAVAGLASPPASAAEPFMDSAPGHCFLCQLFKPRAAVNSQDDNCAKPDQISLPPSRDRREARSDGAATNYGAP